MSSDTLSRDSQGSYRQIPEAWVNFDIDLCQNDNTKPAGGMIESDIPYELGDGERDSPGAIPPKARLHFIVELFDLK